MGDWVGGLLCKSNGEHDKQAGEIISLMVGDNKLLVVGTGACFGAGPRCSLCKVVLKGQPGVWYTV